jgi:hypothetical protein
MANRLELKRTPWDGLIGSSARAVAVPGTVRSLAHTTGGSTGPHRDGSFVGISSRRRDNGLSQPRRCQTALRGRPTVTSVTPDCHLPVTPQKPLRSAGWLFKAMARPPKGNNRYRAGAGESRPRHPLHPGPVASAQFVFGSAVGPHRCALVSARALSQPEAGVGANPLATGSGHPPQRGRTGSRPRG